MAPQATVPTEKILGAWQAIAPDFDRYTTAYTMRLAEQVINQVELKADSRVLDVGAGSGALSMVAAQHPVRVTAVDLAPAMIEGLTRRVAEAGLSNIEAEVMDGTDLSFADDSFDVAMSLNGVSLFPDLQAGLKEMVRVTKPGGLILLAGFGPMQEAEFLTTFVGAIKQAAPEFDLPPLDPPPLPFQLADPARMIAELQSAGAREVEVHPVIWQLRCVSARQLWDAVRSSNPLSAQMAARLSPVQTDEVLKVLSGYIEQRWDDQAQQATFRSRVNVGVGTA